MSLRTQVRDAAAYAHLSVAQGMGFQVSYKSGSASPVTVWAIIQGRKTKEEIFLGLRTSNTLRGITIPRQPNFPPALGPQIGDQLVYVDDDGTSRTYHVDEVEAGNLEATYRLTCQRVHADVLGTK